ncbi:hypothetical protein F4825DRAFT_428028 [Nemania diffusa]|nr:hypothetical protein F4825DRAFT_428028 [Nemania diffusa]
MGGGAISGTIRFLCHLPFGYYAFTGVGHFTFVKDHMRTLLAPPLSPKVYVGEVFSGPIAIICFFWNFFMWIPTLSASGGGLLFIGVVDSLVTGFIIISLAIEATYIGFTHAQCAQLGPNTPHTSNLIFFQRVAEIEPNNINVGEGTCQAYYIKWYVGLVLAILYASSATANILIGSFTWRSSYNRDSRSLYRLLKDIANGLAGCVSSVIPARVHNPLFFAYRYIRHWLYYRGSRAKEEVRDPHSLLLTRAHIEAKEKELYSVLSRGALERIVLNLHYVDVVNLSLTSKRTYKALFPKQDPSEEDDRQLKYYSCWGNEKFDCWACGIQVCKECSKSKQCKKSTISFHMSLCAAACSKCYYKTLSNGYLMKRGCNCNDGREKSTTTYSYGRAQYNPLVSRLVCNNCHNMTRDEVLALRERRDKATYMNLLQQPLSCSVCSESLSRTGLRWWVCSKCKRECRSNCHVGWS